MRKKTKDDALSKRRNVCLDDSFDGPTSPLQEKNGQTAQLPSLEQIRTGIFSDQPGNQYMYTQVLTFKATQIYKEFHQIISRMYVSVLIALYFLYMNYRLQGRYYREKEILQ